MALVIASNIGDALAPSLVPDPDEPGSGNPLLLIILNARNRNLLAVSNHLDAWEYYVVGTLRLLAADPPFYFLGYFYGDAAVRWIESKSPTVGRYARQFEGLFAKASYPLVFLMPNNPICLFAGAAGMRPVWFISLNLSGTVARLYALRWLGDVFSNPIDDVLGWIADNRLWLTALTVTLVVVSVLMDRRGRGELEGITELVEEEPDDEAGDSSDERGALRPALAVGGALVVAVAAAGWYAVSDDVSEPPPAPEADPRLVLHAPTRPAVHVLGEGGCEEWAAGADEVRCDAGGDEAWVVARTGEQWEVQVLRRVDDRRYAVSLTAEEDVASGGPPTWREIGVQAADLDGDGDQEIAFGFHLVGSGGILVTELVDEGVVVAHGELDHGAVRLSERGLETWSARFAADDPSCCPSSFQHKVLQRSGQRWSDVELSVVSSDEVPASEL